MQIGGLMELTTPRLDARRKRAIQTTLLDWFRTAARSLPWRRHTTPYRTWVAEIMAQQTRLDTVVPYFERFMERFPDLASLAAAELDEVLSLWSGLGYYSRGRHLHRAARLVAVEHAGKLPSNPAALMRLPGIGRYTAGAIASIAFSDPVPVLDGNVIRVLSRLFDLDADVTRPKVRDALWDLAGRLVPTDAPGTFNEALMELGALVCTPQGPDCGVCPLTRTCLARRRGTTAERPVITPKRPPRPVQIQAAHIRHAQRGLLLTQNPPQGLFGGLWSCPIYPRDAKRSAPAGTRGLSRAMASDLGLEVRLGPRMAEFEHVLTHRRLQVSVFPGELVSTGTIPRNHPNARWIRSLDQLASLGLARLTRRILEAVGDPLA